MIKKKWIEDKAEGRAFNAAREKINLSEVVCNAGVHGFSLDFPMAISDVSVPVT
jgi:hypothetical protein